MLFLKSVKTYKKFVACIILLFLCSFAFSQHLRAGVYGLEQVPIGKSSNFFRNSAGVGLSAELGFSDKFGESVRFQYANIIPNDDRIQSSWQFAALLGVWYNAAFGESGFSFQPSIEFGIIFEGTKNKEDYGTLDQRAYTDFLFQLCPSFRYKNEAFLNNHIEIEFTPVWSIIPQKVTSLCFIGVRLGIIYVSGF